MAQQPVHQISLLSDFFFFVCVHVIALGNRRAGGRPRTARGQRRGLSQPAAISAVAVEIVANCRAEPTDVKIYLEGSHAANRGDGVAAARPPPAHINTFTGNGLSLCRGSESCSWINAANPQLSSSLCLIDGDGFGSAFVLEKNALFVVVFKNLPTAVLCILCTHARAPSSFQTARKDGCYRPTESHIVPYVAYFSSSISFLLGACGRLEEHGDHL